MDKIEPSKTAILALDVQPVILARLPGADKLVPTIIELLDHGRNHGCHAAFVRVAFREEEWSRIPKTNKRFSQSTTVPPPMHADSEMAAFHPDIVSRMQPNDIVVRKTRYGAFVNTDLDEQLKKRGIDTLIITGFKTSGAVLSAVRHAADQDYRIIVASDAVLDSDEEIDRVLLRKIFPQQADVASVKEIVAALG